MILATDVIHSDPEILGGVPIFAGTRVPFRALIDYLGGGQPLGEFLEDFPSVSHDQAVGALKDAARALEVEADPSPVRRTAELNLSMPDLG